MVDADVVSWCLAVSMLWCSLVVADPILGMEEFELHCRRRGRFHFRKFDIGTAGKRVPRAHPRAVLLFGAFCFQKNVKFATRAAIYRSLWTLRARNRKKVSKKVFLGVRRKVPKNTRKSQKIPKKVRKLVFFDFFGYFLGLFCAPPKRPFLRLSCDFGRRGSGDSCKWLLGSQCKVLIFLRI